MNEDTITRIGKLQKELDDLKMSIHIPREVETAFQERLGTPTGTGTAGSTSSYSSFASPIVVPANPSGTVTIKYRGKTYNLLYK